MTSWFDDIQLRKMLVRKKKDFTNQIGGTLEILYYTM
jgi:hypothetical protein